jgi:hypothetical protein
MSSPARGLRRSFRQGRRRTISASASPPSQTSSDLVRKDDTSALALLATALGHEIVEPLKQATEETEELVHELEGSAAPALRALTIAEMVSGVARAVRNARAGQHRAYGRGRRHLRSFLGCQCVADAEHPTRRRGRAETVEAGCVVGMPRWQAAMMVASLVSNAVEAVAIRGGVGRKITVSVSVEEGAVLEVADNGRAWTSTIGFMPPTRSTPRAARATRARAHAGHRPRAARRRRNFDRVDPGVGTTVRVFLPLVRSLGRRRRAEWE